MDIGYLCMDFVFYEIFSIFQILNKYVLKKVWLSPLQIKSHEIEELTENKYKQYRTSKKSLQQIN